MRQALAGFVIATVLTQLSGCFTYTLYADKFEYQPAGLLLAAEVTIGAAVGMGVHAGDSESSFWYDVAIGIVSALVVDAAIALGVGTSDFVSGARDAQSGAQGGGLHALRVRHTY